MLFQKQIHSILFLFLFCNICQSKKKKKKFDWILKWKRISWSDILEYPWIKEFTYIKNAFFSCLCVHSDYCAQTTIYLVILYLVLVFFVLYRDMSCFSNGLEPVKTKFFSFFNLCFINRINFFSYTFFFFFWIEISVKRIVNFINLTRQTPFLSNLSCKKNFLIILHVTLLCSFLLCNLSNRASRQE